MPINKQSIAIPLALGLNTKDDPWQIAPGQFLELDNVVFGTDKRLIKRNGFASLTSLPTDSGVTTLATHEGNLLGLGSRLYAYSRTSDEWFDQGRLQPLRLSNIALSRGAQPQSICDTAVAPNGIAVETFVENSLAYYQVIDTITRQVLIAPTLLPNSAAAPRTAVLYNHLIVTFLASVAAVPRLQYIAIPLANLSSPSTPVNISSQVSNATTAAYSISVDTVAKRLYVAWDASDVGNALRIRFIDQFLLLHAQHVISGQRADLISLVAQSTYTQPLTWLTWYETAAMTIKSTVLTTAYVTVQPITPIGAAMVGTQITSSANPSGLLSIWFQTTNNYPSGPRSDYISAFTFAVGGGATGPTVYSRSVGLASEAFDVFGVSYALLVYGGSLQPTYFLSDALGNVVARLAGANAGGYVGQQVLPSVSLDGFIAKIAYVRRTQLTAVNKTQGVANTAGIYTQTGIDLVTLDLSPFQLLTAEIGGGLHIAGGMLWLYDGVSPAEHGFQVYPEDINALAGGGGFMSTQTYFYAVTYEWTDGAGNLHRSAPSVPRQVDVLGGPVGSVQLDIPTLRLTYKSGVRIVIYRWSTAQQNYYQVTSVTAPLLNDPSVDFVTYVDMLADASILGNELIYTTGGVIENIAAPACSALALYKSRLILIDSEDPNTLWFSKQVIETTPVEMSDLFTLYVAPTTGAQGSTGPNTALSAMDDKIVPFKSDAAYYITGQGPDNTGAQNDFSDPVFITGAVGCEDQKSIVLMPKGLMFQSNKGIWILGRDLSTSYIGAPIEGIAKDHLTVSALTIPGTTQVRFSLDSGIKAMYDYYYEKWGTFSNVPCVSSTLYQGFETYLDAFGHVFQERPNIYVDGSRPVLISLTTGWLNLAGLQGFERAYAVYILGQYYSPHTLSVGLAYDYNPSLNQASTITPPSSYFFGGSPYYGTESPYGGEGNVEQWRIFPKIQKCEAIQVSIRENLVVGADPGQGVSLSGLELLAGIKSSYPRLSAKRSVG